MMPSAVVLALYALAVTRVTTLVTHDEITRPIRVRLVALFDPYKRFHRAIVYLFGAPDGDMTGCPWCVSIWTGAMTAPILYHWPDNPVVTTTLIALAASQTTGMIYSYGRHQ